MEYMIRRVDRAPQLDADWEGPDWAGWEVAEITHFRPESSLHRPRTEVRLVYDSTGLHGIYRVHDRYVRCVRTNYLDEVWKDSCVEFFAEPRAGSGYFNFEFNCGGAFLVFHVTDPDRSTGKLKAFRKVPVETGRTVQVRSSLPPVVDPEIADPVLWTLQFYVPFTFFEPFIGPLGKVAGQTWKGNFYKCAEEVSHPHWAAWSAVDELNFHLPRCFGTLRFAS